MKQETIIKTNKTKPNNSKTMRENLETLATKSKTSYQDGMFHPYHKHYFAGSWRTNHYWLFSLITPLFAMVQCMCVLQCIAKGGWGITPSMTQECYSDILLLKNMCWFRRTVYVVNWEVYQLLLDSSDINTSWAVITCLKYWLISNILTVFLTN